MLAADLLLLLLDERSGKFLSDSTRIHPALVGAAIVDLVLDGALEIEGEGRSERFARTAQPVRDEALAEIAEAVDGRKVKDAVSGLTTMTFKNRAGDLRAVLLERLVDEGVLGRERAKVLGVISRDRWPEADGGAREGAVRERCVAALDGADPDQETAVLIGILSAIGVVEKVFPGGEKGARKRRAKEIAESGWAPAGVKRAVDAAMTAVVVATTTATVASTS